MATKEYARKYVGGHFEESGKKQFNLLIEEGLKSYHKLLEIGCGNCRAAKFFIKYLDNKKYYGLDHHNWLIEAGKKEVGDNLLNIKSPYFIINDDFNFKDFDNIKFDYALAKSVFTHLTKDKIKQCLDNLRLVLKKNGAFYTSIFEGDSSGNLKESHDNKRFNYSIEEIKELALGWNIESLGNRGCRRQTMLRMTLKK